MAGRTLTDPDLEVRLLDARQQLEGLLRELRSGARPGTVLLGLLRVVSEVHSYLLDAAAERVTGR